jgi:uncharacterized protein
VTGGARRWSVLVAVGVLGGVLSGAFGVGGGILMVPLLLTFAGMDQRRAAATSLAAIVPASVAGTATYLANGEVDVPVGLVVAVGGVAGSLVGTRLLRRLPLPLLRWLFIGLLLAAAARMLLVAPERGGDLDLDLASWPGDWPTAAGLVGVGLVMGVASGLFGIGGGVLLVPALISLFGAGDLVAKGTSLLVMLPTALMGTASNARAGTLDVREGAVVGLAATAASFLGVALAFVLPPDLAGALFAALVLVSAVQLAVRAVRQRHRDG